MMIRSCSILLFTFLFYEWYPGADARAGPALFFVVDIFNAICATQLFGTLAHGGESNASVPLLWQADAVVADLYLQRLASVHECKSDEATPGMSVVHNVGKSFLHDAIGRNFNGGGQRRQRFGCPDVYLHTLRCGTTQLQGTLADGRDEAKLIEGGWTQFVDEAPDTVGGCAQLALQFVGKLHGCVGV